uniref:Nuclear receptor 2C2-associated protein n=1 Tax=Sinocyclocheilus rhinocerous TaxID=307959 RepID=A0A673FSI1_9TELE
MVGDFSLILSGAYASNVVPNECLFLVSHLNHIQQIRSKTMIRLRTKQVTALMGSAKKEDHKHIVDFYPEDNNCLQSFPIQDVPLVQKLKIVFENSADFFGRIIVYTLEILGEKVL